MKSEDGNAMGRDGENGIAMSSSRILNTPVGGGLSSLESRNQTTSSRQTATNIKTSSQLSKTHDGVVSVPQPLSKSAGRRFLYYGLSFLAGIALVTVVLFAMVGTGHLGMVMKQPEQTTMALTNVCDTNEVRSALSSLSKYATNGATADNSTVLPSVKKVVDKVRNTNGYKNDYDCLMLMANYGFWSGDRTLVREAAADIDSFSSRGGFIKNSTNVIMTSAQLRNGYPDAFN